MSLYQSQSPTDQYLAYMQAAVANPLLWAVHGYLTNGWRAVWQPRDDGLTPQDRWAALGSMAQSVHDSNTTLAVWLNASIAAAVNAGADPSTLPAAYSLGVPDGSGQYAIEGVTNSYTLTPDADVTGALVCADEGGL